MATRLYVGGLGERVTEEDLRTTFSHLGSVHSVDIIRTKGRSFAYINFLPSSDNSLAKLFSTYNGCSWKGGKLKLEKAKQHYIDRLKQEWAEDAELVNSQNINVVEVENMAVSPDPKKSLDFEKMQFRMFFPKLRKVKSLPLRGTGKHKYSFQRVQVPPLPVHFCDCPEHYNPLESPKVTRVCDSNVQSDKINGKKSNLKNSVMNRSLNKEIPAKSKCIQPSIEVHDSEIQDGGMNDEEINIMNFVMKKLLDRETEKTERKDLQDSPKFNVPTFELQEDKIELGEETDDDDDIKINVVSRQNVGYDNLELQTSVVNKIAGSNEYWTANSAKRDHGTQNENVKPLNKKRKSLSDEKEEKDLVSPICREVVNLRSQSKESKEHLELNSVTEPKTKKPIKGGMWSQKSSWKEIISDGGGGLFQLSHITPRDETRIDEEPISGGTSSDQKKQKLVGNPVHDEHKHSNKASCNSTELESINDSVHENLAGQSFQSEKKEGHEHKAAQPVEPNTDLDKASRGSSWLHKSSWTQLVAGGNSSSFSISQIMSGEQVEKQHLNKPNDLHSPNNFYSSGPAVKERGKIETPFSGARGSRFGLAGTDKKKDAVTGAAGGIQLSKATNGNDSKDSITTKSDTQQKVSSLLSGKSTNDSCSFMRSADSLKEWKTAKTALTSALKKGDNNK